MDSAARMVALSPAAVTVRRHDPDRFFAALFAPAERREALMLLCAFNHELARARDVTTEPALALMRLQWWREVVEGAHRRHELATPLAEGLDAGRLERADLLAMLDGRELEAEAETPSFADFQDHVRATAGALAVAAGRALGAAGSELDRLRALGTAYGVAGQLRSVAALARQGRCLLPSDLLALHGLSPEAVIARPGDATLRPVLAELAHWGGTQLRAGGGRFARSRIAAALPAVLARRDLRDPAAPLRPRGAGDRLAVLLAVARGRV